MQMLVHIHVQHNPASRLAAATCADWFDSVADRLGATLLHVQMHLRRHARGEMVGSSTDGAVMDVDAEEAQMRDDRAGEWRYLAITSTADGRTHQVEELTFPTDGGLGSGRYIALCGHCVIASSLAAPPGPPCPLCAEAARPQRPPPPRGSFAGVRKRTGRR